MNPDNQLQQRGCVKCGHDNVADAEKGTSIFGMCVEPVKESAEYPPKMIACGCKCEFPTKREAEQPEVPDVVERALTLIKTPIDWMSSDGSVLTAEDLQRCMSNRLQQWRNLAYEMAQEIERLRRKEQTP